MVAGKCLCGQITVSISKETFANGIVTTCHCKNCRQGSGSTGSISLIVPNSTVTITGQPKIYEDSNTASGKTLQRAFCSHCGSPIYTTSLNAPGFYVLKLGLFDEIPKPSMETYCRSRVSWKKPVDDAKQFETMPTN